MAKRDMERGFSPDVVALLGQMQTKRKVIPLQGNAEVYLRDGKPIIRKKTSRMPSLPQHNAVRYCATQLKGRDVKSRADVYAFMKKCIREYKG